MMGSGRSGGPGPAPKTTIRSGSDVQNAVLDIVDSTSRHDVSPVGNSPEPRRGLALRD
jgi:hypothetical protein